MKLKLSALILFLVLVSCHDGGHKTSETNAGESTTADTLVADPSEENPPVTYMVDKSLFPEVFTTALDEAAYNEAIKVYEDYLLVGKDTSYFPNDLALNKAILFKGKKEDKDFELSLTRINQTTLVYKFKIRRKPAEFIHEESGEVVLTAMFFLASEVDEDEVTGDPYASNAYSKTQGQCYTTIRLGLGKDDKGKLRAKVNLGCEDSKIFSLDLDECPVMRTL